MLLLGYSPFNLLPRPELIEDEDLFYFLQTIFICLAELLRSEWLFKKFNKDLTSYPSTAEIFGTQFSRWYDETS